MAMLPVILDSVELKRVGRLLIDTTLSSLGALCAISLADPNSISLTPRNILVTTLLSACAFAVIYAATVLPFRSWRFVSAPDVFRLCRDIALAVLLFFTFETFLSSSTGLPWPTPIVAYCAIITLLGRVRVSYRASRVGKLPLCLDQFWNENEIPAQRENMLVYMRVHRVAWMTCAVGTLFFVGQLAYAFDVFEIKGIDRCYWETALLLLSLHLVKMAASWGWRLACLFAAMVGHLSKSDTFHSVAVFLERNLSPSPPSARLKLAGYRE